MTPVEFANYWSFQDVVFEAHLRAAITRRRYRVTYDRANKIWNMIETTKEVFSSRKGNA